MRPGLRYRWCLAGAVAALSVSAPTALRAGCCADGVAPAGYAFDAFYPRKPIYVVNQGPVFSGPGIYAVPTYTAGGYAYKTQYPYVNSYRVGGRYGYVPGPGPFGNSDYRPYGYAPYGAYPYLPGPSGW